MYVVLIVGEFNIVPFAVVEGFTHDGCDGISTNPTFI